MRARRHPHLAAALLLAALAAGAAPALAQDGGGGQGGDGDPSGASGTTGDMSAPRGQRSTSDVEDPGSGTTGALPGAAPGAGGGGQAGPVVALPEDRVRRVQERLAAAGFDPGPADGAMGARTRAALRAFQEARGLDPTGEPNEPTLAELGVE